MQVTIISNEELKKEWLSHGSREEVDISWLDEIHSLPDSPGVLVDLLFTFNEERIKTLRHSDAELVMINSVEYTLSETSNDFVRINGWNSFLGSSIIEASGDNEISKTEAEKLLAFFNKSITWVPDVPGFITPRVISSIINEAFTALDEEVSTREEIDIAMKLGTNYPYGPFEWAEKIGVQKIASLLQILSHSQSRYMPHSRLIKGK